MFIVLEMLAICSELVFQYLNRKHVHIFILCNYAQDLLMPTKPIGHTLFILIVVNFMEATNLEISGLID